PADAGDLEACARACGRLYRRTEARPADAAHGATGCRARARGGDSGGRRQRRSGRRPEGRRAPRAASGCRQDRLHGLARDGGGGPPAPATQMGSLISTAHREKVHGFVEAADGEVTTGGEVADGPGAFYPPTVIAGLDNASTVAQEEVFGPVVVAIPFEDEADA